jgi:hypothetical protein
LKTGHRIRQKAPRGNSNSHSGENSRKTPLTFAPSFAIVIAFHVSRCGEVAQLVEQRTENPRVAGSTPALATIFFLKKYADLLGFLSYFACFVVSLTVSAFPPDDPLSRHFLLQFYYH